MVILFFYMITAERISITEGKRDLLKIARFVSTSKKPYILTRHKKPLVKIVPYYEEKEKSEFSQNYFGSMKVEGVKLGDIISPTENNWTADEENIFS